MGIGRSRLHYLMPATRSYVELKTPSAFILIIVAIISALFFTSLWDPVAEPPPAATDPERDLSVILRRDLVSGGMTSADLLHIRRQNSGSIRPPTDLDKASALLAQCETLLTEFQEFKDDPVFQRRRFAPGSRFADWRDRAWHLLDTRPDETLVGSDIHRLPSRLIGVANDYTGVLDYPSSQEEWFANFYLPMACQSVQPQE